MGAAESFLTGAFQQGTRELEAFADRERAKKERERKMDIARRYYTAFTKYQTDGTPIDPDLAAEAATLGIQAPAAALRGFDPSVLEGAPGGGVAGPQASQVTPGGRLDPSAVPAGATGGQAGEPLDAAGLFESGAATGPEAIRLKREEQALVLQAKNRQFALKQFHEAQGRVGKKPTSQLTTPEFLELSRKWWAVDPRAAAAFAKEWRRTWTDGSGKPIQWSQDVINAVDAKIDGGAYLREHFDSEEWRYVDDVAPTDVRKRAWLKNRISTKEVRQAGAEVKQSEYQKLWPLGGGDRDLATWATGGGAELSQGKRDYLSKYHFTTGEPNYQAEFEEGWKVIEANQEVVDKRNAPPEIEFMLMRIMKIPPEEIDWVDIAADLPVSMTIEEFKEEYKKVYRDFNNGATPEIP